MKLTTTSLRRVDSLSTSANIGDRLIAAGWKQGSILPALSHVVLLKPGEPASPTSRQVPVTTNFAADGATPHQIAIKPQHGKRFVVISQTCDIARDESVEPFVDVALVTGGNERRTAEARTSVRYFLLDERKPLIVDVRYLVQVEKPLLLSMTPEQGPQDASFERRFRYWLGDRRSRPAFPKAFIEAVRDPMRRRLAELREARDSRIAVWKNVVEVRTAMPTEQGPYSVELVVVLDATMDEGLERAFKDGAHALFGELAQAVNSEHVPRIAFVPLLFNEIPADQYLVLEPLEFGADA